MTTPMEYALLAGAAYESTRGKANKIPPPEGWNKLSENLWHTQNDATGFEGIAFIKGKHIVISYAGTYDKSAADKLADVALGAGILEFQQLGAASYYEKIRQAYPEQNGYRISFTGHSLGGGLAALMGVFFNKPAVTFDPAPFRKTAVALGRSTEINAYLMLVGYDMDKDLASYYAIRGKGGISAIAVDGEFLTNAAFNALRVMNGLELVTHGATSVSGLDLHAQSLLIALKQSESFRQATYQLPFFIEDLFDNSLFAHATDPGQTDRDLLTHLIRREFGVPGSSATDVDLLTKFGNDMFKIGVFGAADNDIKQSLERIAFTAYYQAETGPFDKEFFEQVSGGLRFDMSEMSGDIKGYAQLKTWLTTNAPSEAADQLSNLDDYDRFTLALDTSLSAESPSDDKADLMFSGANGGNLDGGGGNDLLIGRIGADTLKGGSGEDKLYGGSGNDILEGGQGNDTLNGGKGYDTYIWNEGDGSDKITDSDGQGHIEIRQADGSTRIVGGQLIKEESGNTWTSADGQLTLKQGQGWTLTTQSGATLTLDQYKDGDYGLHLNGTPAKDKPTTQTLIGDKKPKDQSGEDGYQYHYDADGNLVVTEEDETDRRDYLLGSYARNDRIEGRGGNDFIDADDKGEGNSSDDLVKGEGGDDILWGNEGRDRLEGGADKDWLDGGPGDDKLYADKETKLADANVQQGTGGKTGDWLNGGEGDDTLIGDKNDDLLMGGPGRDTLAGGAGNDTLYGGWGVDYASVDFYRPISVSDPALYPHPELQWSVTRKVENGESYQTTLEFTKRLGFSAMVFYQDKDDTKGDALYGGAGDDWIMAGEGDDMDAANDVEWRWAA